MRHRFESGALSMFDDGLVLTRLQSHHGGSETNRYPVLMASAIDEEEKTWVAWSSTTLGISTINWLPPVNFHGIKSDGLLNNDNAL